MWNLICRKNVIFFSALMIQGVRTNITNYTLAEALQNDLFANYKPSVRPEFDKRLNVSVGYNLFSIKDFDEKSGTLFSVGGPTYVWHDSRLAWDPSKYGNISHLTLKSYQIWYPDLYLVNPAHVMEPIGDSSFFPTVVSNGMVFRSISSNLMTSCNVDMTYFPFDTQVCNIELIAWGYSSKDVFLTNVGETVILTYFQENSLWQMESAVLKPHKLKAVDGMVAAVISLKRRPKYFVINIFCPIFMLCLLNPLVFLLPTESGERISYTITIFLSLAVFMTLISDNMPKSSEPMSRLSYILLVTMAYSTALCIASIYIMQVRFRPKNRQISKTIEKVISILQWQCLSVCRKRHTDSEVATVKVMDISKEQTLSDLTENKNIREESKTWEEIASTLDKIFFTYSCVFLAILIFTMFVSLLV